MATSRIALLRGINVGGHRVTMERLRQVFDEAGWGPSGTFIQTGNVFFCSDLDTTALARAIAERLEAELGFAVPAVVLTLPQLRQIVHEHPFGITQPEATTRLCIAYLSHPLALGTESSLQCPRGTWQLLGAHPQAAYLIIHLTNGRPASPDLTRATTGPITTRYFPTSQRLLQAAEVFFASGDR